MTLLIKYVPHITHLFRKKRAISKSVLKLFKTHLHSVNANCNLWFCCSVLYMWHLLHVCLSGQGSLLCGSSWGFFHLLFSLFKRFFNSQHGKFFLTRIEGLRAEHVIHCTDCKAHSGNVIVILGYLNTTDLIWFDSQLSLSVLMTAQDIITFPLVLYHWPL